MKTYHIWDKEEGRYIPDLPHRINYLSQSGKMFKMDRKNDDTYWPPDELNPERYEIHTQEQHDNYKSNRPITRNENV